LGGSDFAAIYVAGTTLGFAAIALAIASFNKETLSGLPAKEDAPEPKTILQKPPEVILVKKHHDVFHKPTQEIKKPELVPEQKTISLKELEDKKPENIISKVPTKKAGSPESVSLLKDAIAKAMAAKPNVVPASYMAAKSEPPKEEPAPVKLEVELKSAPSPVNEDEQKKIEVESTHKAEEELRARLAEETKRREELEKFVKEKEEAERARWKAEEEVKEKKEFEKNDTASSHQPKEIPEDVLKKILEQ
jgi:hypothetical protein